MKVAVLLIAVPSIFCAVAAAQQPAQKPAGAKTVTPMPKPHRVAAPVTELVMPPDVEQSTVPSFAFASNEAPPPISLSEKIRAEAAKDAAEYAATHPGQDAINAEQSAAIANHQVFIGMTADMLSKSFGGIWGFLHWQSVRVNDTYTANGLEQQAVYEESWRTTYVYLKDGVVTAIQTESK